MSEVEQVCTAMLAYIQNSLEVSHPLFSGLPVCPFVRSARLQERLEFWVYSFEIGDEINAEVHQKIAEVFTSSSRKDVLIVLHPDPSAISFEAFNLFIAALNQQLSDLGLIAFGGHPDDPFEVNGVRTRHDPFINFTVQPIQKILDARRSLIHNSNYYSTWNAEALDTVGIDLMPSLE